jgi:hypothetical protein
MGKVHTLVRGMDSGETDQGLAWKLALNGSGRYEKAD